MSLEKCVKQLEEERVTEETYHHQQRKYNASYERQEMGQFKYGVELAETKVSLYMWYRDNN
ncbi:hypothetical protein YC2023_064965 [Brassica napus]